MLSQFLLRKLRKLLEKSHETNAKVSKSIDETAKLVQELDEAMEQSSRLYR